MTTKQFLDLKHARAPHKYGAKKKQVDGITFASSKEARRYTILKALESQGLITDLACQVPYPIFIKGQKICELIMDFVYRKDGAWVREDTKGFRTDVYKLKKKMVEAEYGFAILES